DMQYIATLIHFVDAICLADQINIGVPDNELPEGTDLKEVQIWPIPDDEAKKTLSRQAAFSELLKNAPIWRNLRNDSALNPIYRDQMFNVIRNANPRVPESRRLEIKKCLVDGVKAQTQAGLALHVCIAYCLSTGEDLLPDAHELS